MTGAIAKDLGGLLKQALHQVALLESALEQETQALDEKMAESLAAAVARKLQIAQSLEQVTREFSAALREEGFASDAEGMADWLRAKQPPDAELVRDWGLLQDAMQRCQRMNEINGQVLQVQQQYVGQALHILRGGDAAAATYGALGQTITEIQRNTLTKA